MLGENIKNYRQEKGYTQEEVAGRLHVTRQTISKWEKNHSVPDADLLVQLAEILEVETGQLLGNTSAGNAHAEQKDACAEQLAHIAEQMAVKNRQSKRIWKAVGIIAAVAALIAVISIVLVVLGISVYSFDTHESDMIVHEESLENHAAPEDGHP